MRNVAPIWHPCNNAKSGMPDDGDPYFDQNAPTPNWVDPRKGAAMMCTNRSSTITVFSMVVLVTSLVGARIVGAHCDTLDGPVVATARIALERGDVAPVLKWVSPGHEQEIRTVFANVMAVRELSSQAREMADRYFFETLVRIHREGEGAPFTGLKPAGAVDPAVAMADQALEDGSVDGLANALSKHVEEGVRERFARALEARKHADENVDAGREFVEAYVQFTHYVERLHLIATSNVEHHDEARDEAAGAHEH